MIQTDHLILISSNKAAKQAKEAKVGMSMSMGVDMAWDGMVREVWEIWKSGN